MSRRRINLALELEDLAQVFVGIGGGWIEPKHLSEMSRGRLVVALLG